MPKGVKGFVAGFPNTPKQKLAQQYRMEIGRVWAIIGSLTTLRSGPGYGIRGIAECPEIAAIRLACKSLLAKIEDKYTDLGITIHYRTSRGEHRPTRISRGK